MKHIPAASRYVLAHGVNSDGLGTRQRRGSRGLFAVVLMTSTSVLVDDYGQADEHGRKLGKNDAVLEDREPAQADEDGEPPSAPAARYRALVEPHASTTRPKRTNASSLVLSTHVSADALAASENAAAVATVTAAATAPRATPARRRLGPARMSRSAVSATNGTPRAIHGQGDGAVTRQTSPCSRMRRPSTTRGTTHVTRRAPGGSPRTRASCQTAVRRFDRRVQPWPTPGERFGRVVMPVAAAVGDDSSTAMPAASMRQKGFPDVPEDDDVVPAGSRRPSASVLAGEARALGNQRPRRSYGRAHPLNQVARARRQRTASRRWRR
jgi:hypothetical protein